MLLPLTKRLPVPTIALALIAALLLNTPARAQTVDTDFWVTQQGVNAIARDGNIIYIGGNFSYVGPPNGKAVALDPVTGAVTRAPKPNDTVHAVVADGAGGWYIAGAFTHVGGVPRGRLAHIAADGSLSAWNPDANQTVFALALAGSSVYIGGDFTGVGGVTRIRIAEVDAVTGQTTAWVTSANNWVYTLVVDGTTLYAGGLFTSLAGVARSRIGAIDTITGDATSWNPNASNAVYSIALSDTLVYAGGDFTSIGGSTRIRIGAVGANSGVATAWNPNANNSVRSVVVDAGSVYVGGGFTNIGGAARSFAAKIDAGTGLATSWNAAVAGGLVDTILRTGSTVRLGGRFTTVAAIARRALAEVDTTTGALTSWNPNVSQLGYVHSLAQEGSMLYAGGTFASMGGVARNQLAALDATTGEVTSWAPTVLGGREANALVVGDTHHVYVGSGGTSSNVYKLDPVTGASVWSTGGSGGSVEALALRGSTLYVGGNFTTWGGGQPRSRLAATNVNTGALLPWNPGADGTVSAIAIADTVVYIGGAFSTVRFLPRNNLAAIRAVSDSLMPWDPDASGAVRALTIRGSDVYAGGAFASVGGLARSRIAALDLVTGVATAFDPAANDTVHAIAVTSSAVYAAGKFQSIGGASRRWVAELDPAAGTATSWDARVLLVSTNPTVGRSVSAGGGTVHFGGLFAGIGETGHAGFARLFAPAIDSPWTSVWQAELGAYPDELCPWVLTDAASPEAPVLSDDLLTLTTSENEESLYYQQMDFLSIPETFSISARLKVISESHVSDNPRRGVTIGFTVAPDSSNFLSVGQDEVFLWGEYSVQGATAFVDTDDAFHTYTIEVLNRSSIAVYQDGVSILTGPITASPFNPDTPRIWWGDGKDSACAVSEWAFMRHNASTIQCGAAVGVPWGGTVEASQVTNLSVTPYPNPSQGALTFAIRSTAIGDAPGWLKVYDVTGRTVRSLETGPFIGGSTQVNWDTNDSGGRAVSSGLYFVRLEVAGKPSVMKKVTILR